MLLPCGAVKSIFFNSARESICPYITESGWLSMAVVCIQARAAFAGRAFSRNASSATWRRTPSTRGKLQVAAGKKSKLREERKQKEAKVPSEDIAPTSAVAPSPSSDDLQAAVPESPPVEAPQPSSTASDEDEGPPQIVGLFGTIAAIMAIISVFYSFSAIGAQLLFEAFGDKLTFTRKDFVPYSERLRLEREAKEARERDEETGAMASSVSAPPVAFSEDLLPKGKSK